MFGKLVEMERNAPVHTLGGNNLTPIPPAFLQGCWKRTKGLSMLGLHITLCIYTEFFFCLVCISNRSFLFLHVASSVLTSHLSWSDHRKRLVIKCSVSNEEEEAEGNGRWGFRKMCGSERQVKGRGGSLEMESSWPALSVGSLVEVQSCSGLVS